MTVIVVTAGVAVLVPLVVPDRATSSSRVCTRSALHVLRPDQRGVTPVHAGHRRWRRPRHRRARIEQVGLALLWSLPLGLAAAVFLNESRSKWRRPVRIFVDAMSGLPVDRGRPVHLRRAHPAVRPHRRAVRLQRLHGQPGAGHHHAADDHPHGRGGAAPRARRAARGQPGDGRVAGPHGLVGRASRPPAPA